MRFILYTFILIFLTACGGGGGSGGATGGASQTTILQGTAATGAPIMNATVTIQDSVGKTLTTSTDTNGAYSLDVSTLIPPLIIKLEGYNSQASKISLYSALDSLSNGISNTANVTPLTNAAVLIATGETGADFYSNPTLSKITKESLNLSNQALKAELANLIASTNTSNQVDFIKTAFSANKSDVDLLMEYIDIKNKPPTSAGNPSSVAIMGKLAKGGKIVTPPIGGIGNGSIASVGAITNQAITSGINFAKIDDLIAQLNSIINSNDANATKVSLLVALSDQNFLDNGYSSLAFWQQSIPSISNAARVLSSSVIGCNFGSPFTCDISGLIKFTTGGVEKFKLTLSWNGSSWVFYGNLKSTNSKVITTIFRETYFTDTTITRNQYSGFEVVVDTEGTVGARIERAKLYLLKNGSWQLIDTVTDRFGSAGSSFIYKEVKLTDQQIDDFYNAALSTGISSKLEMLDSGSNVIATDYVYGLDLPLKSSEVANLQIPEITDAGIQKFRNYTGSKSLQLDLNPKTGFFDPQNFTWNQFISAGQEIATTDIAPKSTVVNITLKNTVNMPNNRQRGIDFYGFDSEGRPFHTRNAGCNAPNCIP